jgi:hypothetical protein
MNLQKNLLLAIFIVVQCIQLVAQDLRLATVQHFTTAHYPFNKDQISDDGIQFITKTNTYYLNNSTFNEVLIYKYEFDSTGRPTHLYKKEIDDDKTETYFI